MTASPYRVAFEAMVPLNVPNVLTVVRILLVPVLVVALLEKSGSGDLFAAIVFAAASLTDAIDGYLARAKNSVTNFGKLMDPIADKLLIVAALVVLVSLDRLQAWVAMVISPASSRSRCCEPGSAHSRGSSFPRASSAS
jgi:CDP-diacylglycerol--glycerol-3-phosphate 3-phosphatidyltransferase